MIWVGATAYPRILEYDKFAEIATEVDAYLVADIAHINGLIIAGVHPNPFPACDVVSSTAHKMLRGPRAGFLLSKIEDRFQARYHADSKLNLAKRIDRAVFPGLQGGPHMATIAAMAVAFKEAATRRISPVRPAGGRQLQASGRGAPGPRLRPGDRRDRQPPAGDGLPRQRLHRQASGPGAGPRRHHRQLQHGPRRSPQAVRDQRRAAGHAGADLDGDEGAGDGPDCRRGSTRSAGTWTTSTRRPAGFAPKWPTFGPVPRARHYRGGLSLARLLAIKLHGVHGQPRDNRPGPRVECRV